jgi:hypothetical protein
VEAVFFVVSVVSLFSVVCGVLAKVPAVRLAEELGRKCSGAVF